MCRAALPRGRTEFLAGVWPELKDAGDGDGDDVPRAWLATAVRKPGQIPALAAVH